MPTQSNSDVKNLSEMLLRSFNLYGDIPCLKLNDEVLTYRELKECTQRLVIYFDKGEKVGILGQRNLDVYKGITASIFSGATYIPINSKFPLHKKLEILRESSIKKIVCSREDYESNKDFLLHTEIKKIIIPGITEQLDPKVSGYSESHELDGATEGSALAYIMFTSGSTGKPKGVMVTHNNVLALLDNLDHFYPDLNPGYRSSQTFDLSFDPSVCDMFYTWKNGGTLCLLSEKELFCASEYIKREKINFWHSVPLLAEYMGKLGKLLPNEFPELKYSIFTGEPVKKSVVDFWKVAAPKSSLENRYGPTETTVDVLRYLYTEDDYDKLFSNGILPIGDAHNSLAYKIVDPNFKEVATGDKGELLISGPQVTNGYFKDTEKTSKAFIPLEEEGQTIWYRTGDQAFINTDGNVECLGRIDNQIKLAGKRVEIGEVEYFLLKTGILHDLVIVPLRSQDQIVIGITGFTTDEICADKMQILREQTKEDLDPSFFPKKIEQIEKMPTLPSGKVDRNLLEKTANDR